MLVNSVLPRNPINGLANQARKRWFINGVLDK